MKGEEFEEDEEENNAELWDYTPWELLRASIKVFLWDAWQFLKPSKLYRRLHPLSEVEIGRLREDAINQIKTKAAKEFGGEPSDYEVRDIKPKNFGL